MLYELEKAIKDRLVQKLTAIRAATVQKTGVPGPGVQALTNPAVYVSVEEGVFVQQGQRGFRQSTSVYIELEFHNVSSEAERRKGAWVIVEGIIQYLMLQTCGLVIDPLEPKRFRNATDAADTTSGIMRVQLEFGTKYTIEKVDDEVAEDLLELGLSYYLKPGDDIADATDEVLTV